MNKHRLRIPEALEAKTEGWVNICFLAGPYAIRINARDPDLPKFQREMRAFGLARAAGLTTPAVLVLDTDRDLLPWDILITERMPGENGESSWHTMSRAERARLAYSTGQSLALLHSIELPRFGELAPPDCSTRALPRGDTWTSVAFGMLEHHLGEAVELGTFPSMAVHDRLSGAASLRAALDAVHTPALVHNDLHLGNVLHQDGDLSAVLDFEWAIGGDPAMDFVGLAGIEEACPGSRPHYLDGYASVAPLPALDGLTASFYRAMGAIELSNVATRHFTAAEGTAYRQTAKARCAHLFDAVGV